MMRFSINLQWLSTFPQKWGFWFDYHADGSALTSWIHKSIYFWKAERQGYRMNLKKNYLYQPIMSRSSLIHGSSIFSTTAVANISSSLEYQKSFLFKTNDMIGETGMVDNFDVSLSSSFIRKKKFFFLMKLELSETSKLSTIPVSPIMSLFNQFSTRLFKTNWGSSKASQSRFHIQDVLPDIDYETPSSLYM